MNLNSLSRGRSLAVGVAASLVFGLIAAASAGAAVLDISPSGISVAGVALAGADCSAPALSQPFLSWGDTNQYVLAPGQQTDDFVGTGWTLYGDASLASATLLDGHNGSVLDLAPGSIVLSPPVCVASDYPAARTIIRGATGAGVLVGVVYSDVLAAGVTEPILHTALSGTIGGSSTWAPSARFTVHPGDLPGWQVVQFVFANLSPGDVQLYDFYVDPRMSD